MYLLQRLAFINLIHFSCGSFHFLPILTHCRTLSCAYSPTHMRTHIHKHTPHSPLAFCNSCSWPYALTTQLQMLLTHPQESCREKFTLTRSQTNTSTHLYAHTHIHFSSLSLCRPPCSVTYACTHVCLQLCFKQTHRSGI